MVRSRSVGSREALTRYRRSGGAPQTRDLSNQYRRLLGLYGIEFDERYVWD